MTPSVISITPDASISAAARLMLQNKISGLPVIDGSGKLVGIITEGDFLRRIEIGTQRRRLPGVRKIRDHLVWIEPAAGLYIEGQG